MVEDFLPFWEAIAERLISDEAVHSAVVFGSQVRGLHSTSSPDQWSDIDLHLIVKSPRQLIVADWSELLPFHHSLSVVRPASGGVRKLTLIFEEGEADLVLVPVGQMRLVRIGMMLGLHRRPGRLANALNNMATIMAGGYRFIKGESKWSRLYAQVVDEMPGVRISDSEAIQIANTFLCDFLWVLQKNERGEVVAAQRMLHRSLIEANIVLLHELRLRRGFESYQQARRIERLSEPDELKAVQASALLDSGEMREAANAAFDGLCYLMRILVPAWSAPKSWSRIISRESRLRAE